MYVVFKKFLVILVALEVNLFLKYQMILNVKRPCNYQLVLILSAFFYIHRRLLLKIILKFIPTKASHQIELCLN